MSIIARSKSAILHGCQNEEATLQGCLTMKLSDARLCHRKARPIYPNHRYTPCLIEDAYHRDRSNRSLDAALSLTSRMDIFHRRSNKT
jgi:hypothetical protein